MNVDLNQEQANIIVSGGPFQCLVKSTSNRQNYLGVELLIQNHKAHATRSVLLFATVFKQFNLCMFYSWPFTKRAIALFFLCIETNIEEAN